MTYTKIWNSERDERLTNLVKYAFEHAGCGSLFCTCEVVPEQRVQEAFFKLARQAGYTYSESEKEWLSFVVKR